MTEPEDKKVTSRKRETKEGLIFKKIPAVMNEIGSIGKGRQNKAQGYAFRGIDDVYNEIHAALVKHHVFTVPQVLSDTHEERRAKSGACLIYRILTIEYIFYAEDGSSISAVVIGEGMDSGDKASNKAMSVAHKYALLQVFCIPTEELKDPENDAHELVNSGNDSRPASTTAGKRGEKQEYPKDINFMLAGGKKVWSDKFDILGYFGDMKKFLGKDIYYAILKKHGYKKSNEIKKFEFQKIFNDLAFAAETEGAAPTVENVMSPEEASKKTSALILTLIDKYKCDAIEIGMKLKEKHGIQNIKTMDPDQAEGAIAFLESAIKQYKAKEANAQKEARA